MGRHFGWVGVNVGESGSILGGWGWVGVSGDGWG